MGGRSGTAQLLTVCQVGLALPHAALIAGLVLFADEGVRAATPVGGAVEVAVATLDAVLDMGADVLGRLELPDRFGR